MGNFNCKGKLSKESKNQMRGEAYRPSKPDTQGKETIHVEGKPVIKNDDNEDTVVINAKIPFVNPETPTKSESVMQDANTSVSDMNGLKASDSTGKQDRKQHESDAIPEKPVEKTSKDVLSSVIIKNNSGEETNLKKAPPTGISLNKVPDYKSDDAEIEKPGYLFSKGFKGEEAQPEDSGFTDKITGIKVPLPTDQSRSSHDTAPTEKAKDEDKNLTKVDENVPTKTTSGNVSEPTVEIKSNQSNGLKDDSTEKPSDKLQHGNTPSDKLQPGNTPSDKLQPGNTPSDKLQPGSTPSDKLQPENAPSDKLQPGNTPSDKLQPGNTPSDKLRPGNTPSDKLQPENAPSDKLQPGNTPSDKLQPENAPSDKLQPENAPSDNQQNNSDSTGYNHSEFSNPCDEQDKKMSKEMKEIDGKKKKKKEKKPDKYDPLPTANIQNYYGHVGVVNIGNDVVNIVQKKKKKVEKGDNIVQKEKEVEKVPITETFQDTVTISQREMKVLVKVSESVGMFYGPRSTGTCWRVGKDKVLTAAHVVKDNIWSNFHEFLNEEKYKDCYVDFDYNGQQKKDTDSKHFVFEIERTEYISETLDVAVVKLKREIHKDFPPPLEFFDILDPEKNANEHIYLIGHDKGGELQTNYGIGLWNPTEKRLNDLEKFCQQKYGKENGYKELGKKNRLVIQCKFVSGASGCPGVVIHGDKASVVLIYTRGFPDFYYSKNFPEKDKQEFPKARLLQQGVNIGPVFKSMTKNKIYFNLRNEIFPHQASEEQQQLNGQHQYAVDGANKSINTTNPESTFKIVNDLEDHITVRREIENNTAKWTTCTEGHSEKAIPDSAKYNRQPSYALAIDNRVDIAYPNMKPPVDDTDITLPHGHSQNIPVHRNEQNITQETNLDVNKDSQSRMANNSSEIPDMTQGEKSVPYTNPGKTQPVKDITIEMSSSYEPQLCKHCGKLRHQNEGPYECSPEKCSFKSFSKANHERHTRSHSEKRPFECTTCGKCFKGKTELKKHENRENNNKRFQCSYCDKLFEEKKQLKDHLGIHSGVKDHRCTVCNKNFCFRSNLNRHKKTHDVKEEYSYSIFGKLYNRKDNLKQHQAVHNRGIPCTQCEKIFTSKRYLDAHMKRKHQL